MTSQLKAIKSILAIVFVLCSPMSYANVNAINFKLIPYDETFQKQIDFLRDNNGIYNHWVHDWTANIPKSEVQKNLSTLYAALDNLKNKNAETNLLLGDIAHYMYNMEAEEYYEKAVQHYQAAKLQSPTDYRVYWFAGNHFSLSARPDDALENYAKALEILPKPNAHALFWADYSVACGNAGMIGTARYAAHQCSVISGTKSYVEEQIDIIARNIIKPVKTDTTIADRELWSLSGKRGNLMIFSNFVMGTQFAVDSNWNLQLGGFEKGTSYATITPPEQVLANGNKIGYTILTLMKVPEKGQSLQQFLDIFTTRYPKRQNIKMAVKGIDKGILAYEIKDPSMYAQAGGAHIYAIAIEREIPEFPRMKLELPVDFLKNGKTGEINYYRADKQYGRVNSKLYYLVVLDSCEGIHDKSLNVFKDYLQNNLVIE